MVKKEIKPVFPMLCRGNLSPILKCSGYKTEKEFYVYSSKNKNNSNPFTNGYTPYCIDCTHKIYEYYLSQGTTMMGALYYTCQKIDMPFILEKFLAVESKIKESGDRKVDPVGSYIAYLKIASGAECALWTDFSATNIDIKDVDSRIEGREVKKKEIEDLNFIWGKQDSIEDLYFLTDLYSKYAKDVEMENPQQEDLYRDLCRDRLLLRKINDKRYDGDETIDKIQTRIGKLMATLELDKFSSNKPKTITEQSLFEKIRMVDENNVKDIYKEPTKYYDFNKIKKYEEDMCLRPLGNMLVGHRDFDISMEDMEQYGLD